MPRLVGTAPARHPVTIASGKKCAVLARHASNKRFHDAIGLLAEYQSRRRAVYVESTARGPSAKPQQLDSLDPWNVWLNRSDSVLEAYQYRIVKSLWVAQDAAD